MTLTTFEWDELFITGIDEVDDQHHRLIDLINELSRLALQGDKGDEKQLQTLIGQLADYASYHFEAEEKLMKRSGLDQRHIDHHIQIHRKFSEQITSMLKARNSMTAPTQVLLEFLIAWLSFHILGEDQSMARQILRIGQGISAADAYLAELQPADRITSALLGALRNLYHVLSEQNKDLANANLFLEARVAERTKALADANERLRTLSRTDGLMGIANRMYFDERLALEWKTARRNAEPISLLMLDVDYFKKFNDSYGHQMGDQCLKSVAQAASSELLRPADMIARYGGEELVVLLPRTDLPGALHVAERIRVSLAAKSIPHRGSLVADVVTLSIGVAALIPNGHQSEAELVKAADAALYVAKDSGRNQIHWAQAQIENEAPALSANG